MALVIESDKCSGDEILDNATRKLAAYRKLLEAASEFDSGCQCEMHANLSAAIRECEEAEK